MHSQGGGSMGGMSMDDGAPDMFYLQRMYWAVVGAAIGIAFCVSVLNRILSWHRAINSSKEMPAKPKTVFFRTYASITAITREVSNASITSRFLRSWIDFSPRLGRLILVLANLLVVLVLCFYKLDTTDHWHWQDVAYRTGFIAAAQLPLVILLAGKWNIIGFLTGSSYERLNWLHRWVARILFLTATIHMGFWFRSWARYNYIGKKLKTDAIAQRGLAAWCILLWIVLSSFAPVRRWNYEVFVLQHILTFVGFLAAVFLHLPREVKVYVWIPIALYILDRVVRLAFILFTNLALFHPKLKRKGFLTCEAELFPIGGEMSRIMIKNPPIRWRPGQHVFLSCHGIAPLQSHPFTIASLSGDESMEFLVKSKTGATKRFLSRAENCQSLPASQNDLSTRQTFAAIVDGPYGNMRPLRQFDSVILIGGGSGGSFTAPLLRDIVSVWQQPPCQQWSLISSCCGTAGAATRYIRFVWVIKSRREYSWFAAQLSQVADDVEQLRQGSQEVRVDITVYLTRDTSLKPRKHSQEKLKAGAVLQSKGSLITGDLAMLNEKRKSGALLIRSAISTSSYMDKHRRKTCGADRTCCCAAVIEDEEASRGTHSKQRQCHCNETSSTASSNTLREPKQERGPGSAAEITSNISEPSSISAKDPKPPFPSDHPFIKFVTGRPHCKALVRRMLERARGESAVVVCGPRGLNDDVRNSVVALSNERAVNKGTGAQGVYFWEEGFAY